MKNKANLIALLSTRPWTTSQSYTLLSKYSPYLNPMTSKKKGKDRCTWAENNSRIVNEYQKQQRYSKNDNCNNLNHTTLDSTNKRVQMMRNGADRPCNRNGEWKGKSKSWREHHMNQIQLKNDKTFISSLIDYCDWDEGNSSFHGDNSRYFIDIAEQINEIKQKNKNDQTERVDAKDRLKNNIWLLKSEIRRIQRKQHEHEYHNIKSVRHIMNRINYNSKFVSGNSEIEDTAREVREWKRDIANIREETRRILKEKDDVTEDIEEWKKRIKTLNLQMSYMNKEKEESLICINVFNKHNPNLKEKILFKMGFHSDVVDRMANVVMQREKGKSERSKSM